MDWSRRSLLRFSALLSGAVLAGCSSTDVGSTDTPTQGSDATPSRTPTGESCTTPTETSEETPTDTPAETTAPRVGPRSVTLAAVTSDLEETFGVAADVTVTESMVEDRHTARVRVSLENRSGTSRTLSYLAEQCDANAINSRAGPDDVRLWLLPARWTWPRMEDCWAPPESHPGLTCGVPVRTHTVDLAPCGRIDWEFEVWEEQFSAHHRGCMPPGRYEFVRTFGSKQGGDDLEGSGLEGETVTLEIALRLTAE